LALSLPFALATAKGCDPAELGTFEDARLRVERLDEFKAWRASHAFPVAFSLGETTTAQVRAECYWQVPVYADRPERFELWHIFYVSSRRDKMLVMDLNGEPETLAAWRKESLR
jgi:hypothetical protein